MFPLAVPMTGNLSQPLPRLYRLCVPCVTTVVNKAGSVSTMELWEIILENVLVRLPFLAVLTVGFV